MDRLEVNIDNKYTVIQEPSGYIHALRNGEEWRDLSGDKLILSMAFEIRYLRKQLSISQ